jgi:23S rRNA (cytidine2498-2'-O)-methyltransferase
LSELTGYLAPHGFLAELRQELSDTVVDTYGDLVLAAGPARPVAWVANIWHAPERIAIASIGDAAKKLRAIQRNWALYPHSHHRRAALIVEKLPKVSAKPLAFGTPAPTAPLGSWTLLAPDLMLVSASCSSPFPNGEVHFVEDRTAPNRAYLKLWESLTLIGHHPQPGELCLDLGSSPGGWTWVLQKLGARVISVDKASLDPHIVSLANVVYRRESAFALEPQSLGRVDWLVADIACYPPRLLTLVCKWLAAGTVRRFICTIKFQGPTDLDVMAEFSAIPGSRLVHLHHNKHELTWIYLGGDA